MADMAKQFREQAEKAEMERKRLAEKQQTELERKLSCEVAKIKGYLLGEVRRASGEGRLTVRVPALRIGASDLSSEAISVLSRELSEVGFQIRFEVKSICLMPLGEQMPGRHDIEGWERYDEKRRALTRRVVSDITISW